MNVHFHLNAVLSTVRIVCVIIVFAVQLLFILFKRLSDSTYTVLSVFLVFGPL